MKPNISLVPSPEVDPVSGFKSSLYQEFQKEVDKRIAKTKDYKPKNIYASQFHPCIRRQYHDLVDSAKRPPFPVDLIVRFKRGNDREVDWTSFIPMVGKHSDPPFSFEGAQERVEITDRKGRVVITGRADGFIRFADGSRYPMEIKSWNENLWRSIEDVESLLDNPFMRGAVYQLLAYLYGKNLPKGIFFFDGPGFPKVLTLHLEKYLDRMEAFLANATRAMDAKTDGIPPEPINIRSLCNLCWARDRVCFPEIGYKGVSVIGDPECIERVRRYMEIKGVGKEAGKLWEIIKEDFKEVEEAVCGNYEITGKAQKKTSYPIPAKILDPIKKKYKKVDPEGTWKIKIEAIKPADSESKTSPKA